ncbi:Alpha beta [Seminavis robusta]|uniref:Alpha beta n=1 Tax=Seminavis robusta TaxID=568900 RepID=A0A9N8ELY5_9STRA|nr:Alpha beta [Seminavis robusta]|eukprot:Sro1337_g264060.1 Alpha beta (315) ;mRNA; f:1232-2176
MRFLFLIIGIVVYLALSWEHAYTRSVSLYSGKVLTLANLTTEAVNGHHHALTIRTAMSQADVASHQAPVLLILHGGPAWSDIPFLYGSDYLLEEHFIVVHYDQRSAGKSCRYYGNSSNNNFASHNNLTIQQHVDDAVAIVQYLQKKFHQEKVYLMGGSWGSVLSLLAAKQQPDLFHFVAVHGTLVNGLSNELISREFILHQFPTANIPMPPYKSVDELVLQRQWLNRAGGVFYKDPLPATVTRYIPQLRFRSQLLYYAVHLLLAPEFSWGDKLRFGRCYRETCAIDGGITCEIRCLQSNRRQVRGSYFVPSWPL